MSVSDEEAHQCIIKGLTLRVNSAAEIFKG